MKAAWDTIPDHSIILIEKGVEGYTSIFMYKMNISRILVFSINKNPKPYIYTTFLSCVDTGNPTYY